MRTIDFAYRVLRGGAFYGYLQAPADGSPTIRMEESAEIKTSLSGSFSTIVLDASGNRLEPNWLADEIQPVLIIDGVEHPLGIFAPASVTPGEDNGIETMQVEAFDRCWRVRDTYTGNRLYYAVGTTYITAIKSLLADAGIGTVLATPNAAALAEDREWEIGTSYLTVINELLGEINYNPLFFDAAGYAIIEPASVPTADNIEHRISDEPEEITAGATRVDRMLPQISRETDVYNTPNVFVCVCANPEKSNFNMVATAENTNSQSPLSIGRRGRRIVQVTQLDNIASQEDLQAYADRQRNLSMTGGETIRISTALQPGYGVDDVVALRYRDLTAICILRAYTMELRLGGTMQMALEKVVYNVG